MIFTLALSLTVLATFANRGFSELNLKLAGNSSYDLKFDDAAFSSVQGVFSLANIKPGFHFLSVSKTQYVGYWNYTVTKRIFSGFINIPVNARLFAMINGSGNYVLLSKEILMGADDTQLSSNFDGFEEDYTQCNEGQSQIFSPEIFSMSVFDFANLKMVINNADFESSKLSIAKQAVASNFFTSQQVKQLLDLFDFESSRLELAKLAYDKVIDKGNFFIVNDAFCFESSIDELSEFIIGK